MQKDQFLKWGQGNVVVTLTGWASRVGNELRQSSSFIRPPDSSSVVVVVGNIILLVTDNKELL